MTIILSKKKSDSIAIHAVVMCGSINEEDKNRGVSHFIEHMLFEGTKNRTAIRIANDIESLGGTLGAYTSAERTCFYAKVLRKHANIALDVLSDIIKNPLFDEKAIEKEREVILSEVNMKKDEPRFHQWSLFQRTLFKDFPLKHPVIGYEKTVKSMKRKDLVKYFNKQYVGSNIILSVVGDTDGIEKILKASFEDVPKKASPRLRCKKEKIKKSVKIAKEKKPIKQTYMVVGYVAPDRINKDSYVFDVIHAILGRGLSGRLFDELRIKRGLGYDVGCHYEDNKHYGFFAAYSTVEKKNAKLAKEIMLKEIQRVDDLTTKELNEAKMFIEGEFKLDNEDNSHLADILGQLEHIRDAAMINDYIKNIKKVTIKDISRVKKKYLGKKNYTMVVLEQKE